MNDYADGTRTQASIDRAQQSGRLPEYDLYGFLLECVVVAVRFPGDSDNVTGFIEYDCDPLVAGVGRVPNCVRLEAVCGLEDGDEATFRVANARVDGGPWMQTTDPRWEADGDRVIVTFLNGSKDRPVIIGCHPHPQSKITRQSPDDPASRVRTVRHRGTKVGIDNKGNVSIDVTAKAGDAEPAGTVTVTTKAGATVFIDNEGNVTFNIPSDKKINIGSPDSAEPLVLGEVLKQALTDLVKPGAIMSPVGPCTVDPTWKPKYVDNPDTNVVSKNKNTER